MNGAPPVLTERFLAVVAQQVRDRRPGPLTEGLSRAVAELTWLVARDDAEHNNPLWLWVDLDLHRRQAHASR